MSRRRRLAQALARHALSVTPPERRAWAQGMAAELAHIDDDGAAFAFAAGAVWTGYQLLARELSLWLVFGRWGVAACALADAAVHLAFLGGQLAPGTSAALSLGIRSSVLSLALLHLLIAWSLIRWRPGAFAALVGATSP